MDYAKTLDCIHCGLCLHSCPTYRLAGVESSSPRGRIHLMRAVGEGRLAADAAYAEELDFCLLCRHCESVCPAGVRFGEMMELARDHVVQEVPRGPLARLARRIGFRLLLPRRGLLRGMASLLRLAQRWRLDRLAARLLGERGAGLADLPRVPPLAERRSLPTFVPAAGPEQARVALLEGCVQPELFPGVGRATADALAALGVASHVPRGVVCCGSLHAHNGDGEGARELALRALAAFEDLRDASGEPVPIVMNSAGCGAHLKELANLFPEGDPTHARAAALAARVVDFAEYVAPRLEARELDASDLAGPLTWDDPCHLCHAQGVRAEPRRVLARLRGVEVVPLPDSEACCGSAGIYSLLRPADSRAVFERKLAALRESGAATLVTANPGCQIQWESGLRRAGEEVHVVHLAELVARALGRADPV